MKANKNFKNKMPMTVAAQQNSFLRNVSCGERKCLSHSGRSDSSEAHNEPSSRCKSCVCVFPFNGDQPNLACMATVELRKKICFICANRSFEGISAQYQPPQSGPARCSYCTTFCKTSEPRSRCEHIQCDVATARRE